jgi:hypothetical protein
MDCGKGENFLSADAVQTSIEYVNDDNILKSEFT